MNTPESQAQYTELRREFPDYLIDFFPKKLPNNLISFGSHSPDSIGGPGRAFIGLKFSRTEFEELKNQFSANSLYRSEVDSGCFEVVGLYSKQYKSNCEQNFPVAEEAIYMSSIDFKSKDPMEKFELRSDSEILIVKMDGMRNSNLRYVKGVTISEKSHTVVYWFVIYY